jgi:hypothetical protein
MTARILASFTVALIFLLTMLGCSGGGPTGSPSAAQTVVTATPPPSTSSGGTVSVEPSTVWLGASQTQQFTATVNGVRNASVTWTVNCDTGHDCGTISATGLYTAPASFASNSITWVNATPSTPANFVSGGTVRLMAIDVMVTPNGPANVPPGGSREFTAEVFYDVHDAGVTWALSGKGCSGEACGTLSNVTGTSVVYHAPATAPNPPAVTLTATSVSDIHKSRPVMFTVSDTPSMLLGKYAFLINGWRRESGNDTIEAIAGHFESDGTGTVSGIWDANRGGPVARAQAITGSYNIQPNGRGTLEFRAGSSTWTYVIALDANGTSARLAESTIPSGQSNFRGSSGYLVKQDETAFALSSTQGDRVIALSGEADCCNLAALGRFTADPYGSLGNTAMDLSWDLHNGDVVFPNSVTLAGSFAAPDTGTGRGIVSMTLGPSTGSPVTYAFAYYIVSAETMLLVQTDTPGDSSGTPIPTLSGQVQKQNGAGGFANASLNALVVFHISYSSPLAWCGPFPANTIGQMAPNGSGLVTTTFDQDEAVGSAIANETVTGTYSVAANGRVTLNAGVYSIPFTFDRMDKTAHKAVAYLVDENRGFVMQEESFAGLRFGPGGGLGAFEPQSGVPFSPATLAGTYLISTGAPTTADAQNDVGWLTLAEDGSVTGTVYVNTGMGALPYEVTGTFEVASNGRGRMTLPWPSRTGDTLATGFMFWASSLTRMVAMTGMDGISDSFYLGRMETE